MTRIRVATGIDIPMSPSCGSMILCSDVYRLLHGDIDTTFFALPPRDHRWHDGYPSLHLLTARKQPYGRDFAAYVEQLAAELRPLLSAEQPDLIHAQHLGFGLSLAFSRLHGTTPMLAVGHGTDVIAAQQSQQARDALCEVVAASLAVAVPTISLRDAVDHLTQARFTSRLHVVPWGIPLDRVTAVHRPHHEPVLNLLHAGRLDDNKSTITAIESLSHASHRHRLTVIGSGDMLPLLQRATDEMGPGARTTFMPFMSRDDLWRNFPSFDALLFTTRDLEAFGLVAVEAQAHGLPVIYSAVAGATDTLGESGLPFPPGDPAALARRVDLLAEDPALRRELSERAIANASRYPLAATAADLVNLTRLALRETHG